MKRHRLATTARSIFVLLAFAALVALPSPALADEGTTIGDAQDLTSLLNEQGASVGDDAAQTAGLPALTAQAIGSLSNPIKFGSTSEVNQFLKKNKNSGEIYIQMSKPWSSPAVHIPDNVSVTIDMRYNGIINLWRQKKNDGGAFVLGKGAKLHLIGPKDKRLSDNVYAYTTGGGLKQIKYKIGAYIAGGYNTDGGGAITMKENSVLTMDNVSIFMCRADQKGGSDGHGGAIYATGSNAQIFLNNCDLIGNYAENNGGAIAADNKLCRVFMKNSTIDGNIAATGSGGGVYFNGDASSVVGDSKSSIRYCHAYDRGGGVFLDNSKSSLASITIDHNNASNGGGVYANSTDMSFSSLTVSNNTANNQAGGIYVKDNRTGVSGCTITGNVAKAGGGAYVREGADSLISFGGDCVIRDNKQGGDLVLGKKARVEFGLTVGADVRMAYETFPETYARVTPDYAQQDNCLRYLRGNYNTHLTYNSVKRAIYIVQGSSEQNNNSETGSPLPTPKTPKTLSGTDIQPKSTGQKYNNFDVIRGFVRFPSVVTNGLDSATAFYYSDGYFVGDPKKYDPHLATASMCMAMSGFYLNAGGVTDYTNKHASARQFMADIGCADDDIYVNNYNVQKPGSFTIGVTIASKNVKASSNNEFTLVPVAIRGAGYEAEWTSNVTLGYNGEHKGFADAADKVTAEVNAYLVRHNLVQKAKEGKVVFWIAGYSRAGATTNLTAKRLIDQYANSKCKVFAYPMEAPQGGIEALDKNPESYYSIHNVINQADLVPLVGPTKMGFKRYGVDHYIPGSSANSDNIRKIPTYADRAGQASNYETIYKGLEPMVDMSKSPNLMYRYADNVSCYTDTAATYPPARSKMIKQLSSVDPTIVFDDSLIFAESIWNDLVRRKGYHFPSINIENPKDRPNTEKFILDFIGNVQRWAVGNRIRFGNVGYEKAFQEVIGTVFSLDNVAMSSFANRASNIMNDSAFKEKGFWSSVIHGYHEQNMATQQEYRQMFITCLENVHAFDDLPPEAVQKIKKQLHPMLDFAFRVLRGDNYNKAYNTADGMFLATFARNSSRIMANHFPEVNLAWLRADDSFYKNENDAYLIAKASSVASPRLEVNGQTAGGQTCEASPGKNTLRLDVKDLKGEAIYYKLSKGDKQLSPATCKYGYDIYCGPIQVEFDYNATYSLSTYAMSYDSMSSTVHYTIKANGALHKVTILAEPEEIRKGNVTPEYYSEAARVKLEAQEEFETASHSYELKSWQVLDEKGRDVTSFGCVSYHYPGYSLNMPIPNEKNGLSKDYSLIVKAKYAKKERTDNINTAEVEFNGKKTNITFHDGELYSGVPDIPVPVDESFGGWKVILCYPIETANRYIEYVITNQLKPETNGKWNGKDSFKLSFVGPMPGQEFYDEENNNGPIRYQKISSNDTSAEIWRHQKIVFRGIKITVMNCIDIGGVADPEGPPSKQVEWRYWSNDKDIWLEKGELSPDVKWDKSERRKKNPDTTETVTTTYTTSLVCPKPEKGVFAKNGDLKVRSYLAIDGLKPIKVEKLSDGTARLTLTVVKTKVEGTPITYHTINVMPYDVNDATKTPLRNAEGKEYSEPRNIEVQDNRFVAYWSPNVPGGESTGEYSIPSGDTGLKAIPYDSKGFEVADPKKPLVLLCGVTPVIDEIHIEDFPVPVKGEPLATKEKDSEAIKLSYEKPAGSVFEEDYKPEIEKLTWVPAAPADGKAEGGTRYSCIIELDCDREIFFDRELDVSIADGLDIASAEFDRKEETLYLTFERTARRAKHTVMVKSKADGNPTKNIWEEGETKSVTATDSYEDKIFDHWTVTCGDYDLKEDELAPLGINVKEGDLKDRMLVLTMPEASSAGDAIFDEDYELGITANYRPKSERIDIEVDEPKVDKDLANTATVRWAWGDGHDEQRFEELDVSWTEKVDYGSDASESQTTSRHSFEACMRLDADCAKEIRRGDSLPKVFANDGTRRGTVTWNADGSLTIKVPFAPIDAPLPAYFVKVGAYDANSPASKLKADGKEISDEVRRPVAKNSDGSFALIAPAIKGAKFDKWEIPEGSKVQFANTTEDRFKFAEGATAKDACEVHALYVPIVKTARLTVVPPVAGQPLAKEARDINVTLGNDAFAEPTNVTGSLTWHPSDVTAAYDTEYAAEAKLSYNGGAWRCAYADDVSVTCDTADESWLADDGIVRLVFARTDREKGHKVTVQASAQAAEATTETWYEGQSMAVKAKQYDDELFCGWTVKCGDKDLGNSSTDLDKLGIKASDLKDQTLVVNVPVASKEQGATFQVGYALSITANYRPKSKKISVSVADPKVDDLAATATLSWSWGEGEGDRNSKTVDVSWTDDAEYGDKKIVKHKFTATMRLDDESAAEIVDTPSVERTGTVEADGNATQNEDGSLTITLEFDPIDEKLPAYAVTIGAYDTNSPTHKLKEGGLDRADVERVVARNRDGSFALVPPVIDGAEFDRWEIPNGSKVALAVGAKDRFKFADNATAVDNCEIHALYKPVVSDVELKIDAPKPDTALATTATATIGLKNKDAFASATPKVNVSKPTWDPNDVTAKYSTSYIAKVGLVYVASGSPWSYAYADDVNVECDTASAAWFDEKNTVAYVHFKTTERDTSHTATIYDAAAGSPMTETWYEGEAKYLKAETEDDVRLFVNWKVTLEDKDGKLLRDVTNTVLIPGAISTDPAIGIRVPEVGDECPEGYVIVATANYGQRSDEVRVAITEPGANHNLAKQAELKWDWRFDGKTDKKSETVDVSWTTESRYDETSERSTCVATMHLSADKARYIAGYVSRRYSERPTVTLDGTGSGKEICKANWRADGSLDVTVTFTVTGPVPANEVTICAYDANNPSSQIADVSSVTRNVAKSNDGTFVLFAPDINGAKFDQWIIPNGSEVEFVDKATGKFKFVDNASAVGSCEVHALYVPVVKNVVLTVAAPVAGQPLATKATAKVADIALENEKEFTSTNPDVTISELTWEPTDETAAYDTEYAAKAKLSYNGGAWKCAYADDATVTCDTADDKWIGDDGTLFATFERTDREKGHKVTVQASAQAAEATTENWYEGQVMSLTAKQYGDKLFSGWTVTLTAEGKDATDVTEKVLVAGTKRDDGTICVRVPAVDNNQFPKGYGLNIAADYHVKADEVRANIQNPEIGKDLADTATLSWDWVTDAGKTTALEDVTVAWTEEVDYGDTTATHALTATMRVGADKARQLRSDAGLPRIVVNGTDAGKAAWNADGSLDVTATFTLTEKLPATQVTIVAYDANAVSKLEGEQEATSTVVKRSDGSFVLVAPVIDGAKFDSWVIPAGSKVEAVSGKENVFKFVDGATAEDSCEVHALYVPVVRNVALTVAAPVAGQPLATKATAKVAGVALENEKEFTSTNPDVTISELTWEPTGETAAYDTEYAAKAKLSYNGGAWKCAYADDATVKCDTASVALLDWNNDAAYLAFPATAMDESHQVTIDSGASGTSRVETWYGGETRYVVADEYDDRIFTGWTVTLTAEDMDPRDVTAEVLVAGTERTDTAIGIMVPMVSGDTYPKGYGLEVVASYKDKLNTINVSVPQPIGPTGTASWTDGDETKNRTDVPITWSLSFTEETSGDAKSSLTSYDATLHLTLTDDELNSFTDSPYIIAQPMDESSDDGHPMVAELATANRVSDGFAITVPFMGSEETIYDYRIELQACDVNTSTHDVIMGTKAEETFVDADDEDGFTLYAPDVEDGVFVGWEFDENVLAKSAVEGDASAATFTFKTEKRAEDAETTVDYVVKALYKPVVDYVGVDFARPESGQALATALGATATLALRNADFQDVHATVTDIAWKDIAGNPAPEGGKADFSTTYTATATFKVDEGVQYAFDDGTYGAYGAYADLPANLNTSELNVAVRFDATDPVGGHDVQVIDNAYGVAATHSWREGTVRHIVADEDSDHNFDHTVGWTITDETGSDVTGKVLTTGSSAKDETIAITMPTYVEGNAFPTKDYKLTIKASFIKKANELGIAVDPPASDALDDKATWTWSYNGADRSADVDVTWTAKRDGTNTTYTASMFLAAEKADELSQFDLGITVNGDAGQVATSTWDADGNLTVTTGFRVSEAVVDETRFVTVNVQAFDVNAGKELPANALANRSYEIAVDPTGLFVLPPHTVAGGAFHGWEVPAGSDIENLEGNRFKVTNLGSQSDANGLLGTQDNPASAPYVIRANYKPVISAVNVVVNAPETGKALPTTATATVSLANASAAAGGAFASPKVVTELKWHPAADSVAQPNVAYEAEVKLSYQKSETDTSEWLYAYADDASVTTPGMASVEFDANASTAYVTFQETSWTRALTIMPVEDLTTSYENNNADAIQALLTEKRPTVNVIDSDNPDQEIPVKVTWETPMCVSDGGKLEGCIWRVRGNFKVPVDGQETNQEDAPSLTVFANVFVSPTGTLNLVAIDRPEDLYDAPEDADEAAIRAMLPETCDLLIEEGVVDDGAISWTSLTSTEPENTVLYGAKWLAKGTVSLPDDIDNPDNVDLNVTMNVYTAAPEEEEVERAQMPYALPDDDVVNLEKEVILGTDEPDGTVYYRIVLGANVDVYKDQSLTGDAETSAFTAGLESLLAQLAPNADDSVEFMQYEGETISVNHETVSKDGVLAIEAYTEAPGKEQSEVATFVYELSEHVLIPDGDKLTFNGTEQIGVLDHYGYKLHSPSEGARIDEYGNVCATAPGVYTVTATLENGYKWLVDLLDFEEQGQVDDDFEHATGDQIITFTISKASIEDCDIDPIDPVAYTGDPRTPEPKLWLGDYELVKDRDYTLTYGNNVEPGTATVTVTGIGGFKDSVDLEFEIERAPIGDATVDIVPSVTYTGGALTPKPVVRVGDKVLVEGRDYTLSYANNVEPGTATVTITGIGNYQGTAVREFTITKSSNPTPTPTNPTWPYGPTYPWSTPSYNSGNNWMNYDAWLSPYGNPYGYGGYGYRYGYRDDGYRGNTTSTTNNTSNTNGTQSTTQPIATISRTNGNAGGSQTSVRASDPDRLAGADRYQTAAKVSAEGFASSKRAVLATGDNFPDALSASGLAGTLKCPVVLTASGRLTDAAKDELKRLGAGEVYVMGGENAISSDVAKALEGMGITVRRVSGADRTATSVAALRAARECGSTSDTVVVVSGNTFADALSCGPWAWSSASPVLLTGADGRLTDEAIQALRADGRVKNVVIVGGTSAVSAGVEGQLDWLKAERVAGADRYETSAAMARWSAAHGMSYATVGITTGRNYPDALAGSALLGSRGGVLLLTDSTTGPATDLVKEAGSQVRRVYTLGGPVAVSDEVASSVKALVG